MSRILLKTPVEMLKRIAEYAKANGEFIDTDKSDLDCYSAAIGNHHVTALYEMDQLDRVDVDKDTSFSIDGDEAYCDQGEPNKLLSVYDVIS